MSEGYAISVTAEGRIKQRGDTLLLLPQRAWTYQLYKQNGKLKHRRVSCRCREPLLAALDLKKSHNRDMARACREPEKLLVPARDSLVMLNPTVVFRRKK